jgi:5-hydroxyisourate hydrolase-like protein (transthyretin family)
MSHPDPVSSHVLDTSSGFPADDIVITMSKWSNQEEKWIAVNKKYIFVNFLNIGFEYFHY